jgi:hypothetical protein
VSFTKIKLALYSGLSPLENLPLPLLSLPLFLPKPILVFDMSFLSTVFGSSYIEGKRKGGLNNERGEVNAEKTRTSSFQLDLPQELDSLSSSSACLESGR